MVDDTCHQLDFDNTEEAQCIFRALHSNEIQGVQGGDIALERAVGLDRKSVV